MTSSVWPWPLPALVGWLGGWIAVSLAGAVDMPPVWALLASVVPSLLTVSRAAPGWRRLAVLSGMPLSLALVYGATSVPSWAWLTAIAALLVIYPMRAWRDAPLFPTPPNCLDGLSGVVWLPPRSRVLDAGSGLGDGLRALARVWPRAQLHGIEGGWMMALLSRLRVPGARIQHGDFWVCSWADFDLVYLFQRPESMPRAWAKALAEMAPGTWLVSLEFEVPEVQPTHQLTCPDGRALWVYQVPVTADLRPGASKMRPLGR